MNLLFKLTYKFLKNRDKKCGLSFMSWISIAGIAFGVCACLISMSVIDGFNEKYKESLLGFNAHLVVVIQDDLVNDDFSLNKEIEHNKNIISKTPFIFREGLGLTFDEVQSVVIKGVDSKEIQTVYPMDYQLFSGNLNSLADQLNHQNKIPSVLLGKKLFERFFPDEKNQDKKIRLLIPKSDNEKSNRLEDYAQEFNVIGTFESGLFEFDSQFILMNLSSMQKLFHLNDKITGFELKIKNPNQAESMASDLREKFLYHFDVISWTELNEPLFQAMKMEKVLFFIIMFGILGIASFNMVGSLIIIMIQNQPQIAILRAMGLKARQLIQLFTYQGLVLGSLGLVIGVSLSYALLWSLDSYQWIKLDPQVYFIQNLPVSWSLLLWFKIICGAFFICYLASTLASLMALRFGKMLQSFR